MGHDSRSETEQVAAPASTETATPVPSVFDFKSAVISQRHDELAPVKVALAQLEAALKQLPASRELSLAFTKLDELSMWVEEIDALAVSGFGAADRELSEFHAAANAIRSSLPACRERSCALTKLDEAAMWAGRASREL